MLIGQAGSKGGKARQEVGVEQRDWKYSGKQEAPSAIPAQTTKEQHVSWQLKKVPSHMANIDNDNGLI